MKGLRDEATDAFRGYLPVVDVQTLAWPDVDALNERAVGGKRRMSLEDLLADLKTTHEQTVDLVGGLTEEALGVPEIEKRIRVDTFAHYAEHTDHIHRRLGEGPSV